ncbi:hypothetical protein XH97_00420 [Bradyrhizobium sp. CCBAU 53380]|nr:hypothetical protein [Bradyrhizobium sp. CCBAU 53380]
MVAKFHVGALHRRPGGAVSDLFLPEVPGMRGKGVVERLPVDVQSMRRQMVPHAWGKILVRAIGHRRIPYRIIARVGSLADG